MIRPFFVTAVLFACSIMSNAQLTMTPEVIPTGIIQKPQLWNILLLNNTSITYSANLSLVLTNTTTSDIILTANTLQFVLAPGTSQMQAGDFIPIQYEYPSPGTIDADPNGFIPVGEYEACYTLTTTASGDHGVIIVDECVDIVVEPLSPPLLSMPQDMDMVETAYPQFIWQPPTPLFIFNTLLYDLLLVEVHEGQTPIEAMQQNMPVYTEGNMSDIFLNYPASNYPLDTGKLYAWQIIAKDNNQYAIQSEVWAFRVRGDSIIPPAFNLFSHVKLKRELDASVNTCTGTLMAYYINEPNDSTISYSISSLSKDDLGNTIITGTYSLVFGENYLDIDLSGDNRLIDGNTYLFELTNSRNERWVMKFVYLKEESAE